MRKEMKWTKHTINKIRQREYNADVGEFDQLIIVPGSGRRLHDSGFRCMSFIAVKDNKPLCRMGGYSDVIHVGGITGLNKKEINAANLIEAIPWSIDCLPCGYLRILTNGRKLSAGPDLYSFELFAGDRR